MLLSYVLGVRCFVQLITFSNPSVRLQALQEALATCGESTQGLLYDVNVLAALFLNMQHQVSSISKCSRDLFLRAVPDVQLGEALPEESVKKMSQLGVWLNAYASDDDVGVRLGPVGLHPKN